MTRGDLVTAVIPGDFGKPRPALVIQSEELYDYSSVAIIPLTSALSHAPMLRIGIRPTLQNGLTRPSQIMIDKITTVRREKIGSTFGRVAPETLAKVERYLALFLGLSK